MTFCVPKDSSCKVGTTIAKDLVMRKLHTDRDLSCTAYINVDVHSAVTTPYYKAVHCAIFKWSLNKSLFCNQVHVFLIAYATKPIYCNSLPVCNVLIS